MDEKGFVMELASQSKVICRQLGLGIGSDGKHNVKAAVKIGEAGNRELLTVIDFVAADGRNFNISKRYAGFQRKDIE